MESLRLAEPCARYAQQIEEYRLEFLQTGSSMDGTSSLRRFERAGDWLDWVTLAAKAQTCPLHWVPDQQYLCIRAQDDRLVGMADLRLAVNEKILLYYGQIGYSLRPGERDMGTVSSSWCWRRPGPGAWTACCSPVKAATGLRPA